MSEKSGEEDPKLIIDEDWKTQVQREKEELARQAEASAEKESSSESGDPADSTAASETTDPENPASETVTSETGTGGEPTSDAPAAPPPPPPASLTLLVTSLATQAMASMGQLPGEDGQTLPTNLDYARHFIDLIGVVEEKTQGNLDDAEQRFVQETLHQMRMMFVSASQKPAS